MSVFATLGRRNSTLFLVLTLCLSLSALLSCGYVGEPLPPALNIPTRVTDLRAFQRADKIVIQFTIPEFTTEGLPLKLGEVELRAGPWSDGPFDSEAWAAQARVLETTAPAPGPVEVETSARDWIGREVFLRVRVLSAQRRDSGWSDFTILRVIPPLETPSGLRAEAVSQGVRLTWQGPEKPAGVAFRVRRRTGEQENAGVVATVAEREWVDTETRYGTGYEYTVQTVAKSAESEAESEISDPVQITPEDRFPPSVPAGLTALAGVASIELAWERNLETDFRGYRLYRSTGDEPFQRIADLVEVPSYSDRSVEAGKRYRYAVSAVDLLGNESERSQPVEIHAH